jgi:hypothetical protein
MCLTAGSALAEQCDRWDASMQEDEGGPQMMASICAKADASAPRPEHYMLVTCAGNDAFAIRYLPSIDMSYPPGGNEEYQTKMSISVGTEKFTLDGHFESMDGAIVVGTEAKSALFAALMSGKNFTISDLNEPKLPVVTFALKGSKPAFAKLIKTCGQ